MTHCRQHRVWRSICRRAAAAVTVGMAAIAATGPAVAGEDYPAKPITLVVPFTAGGPVDTLARIVSAPLSKRLGQPIIVDNVAGAAGIIGVGRVAKAAPDGYTLSIGHWSTHVINGAIYNLPYDLLSDFEPLGMIATNPMMVVASAEVPAANFGQLITWLKAHPDKASLGTAGVGSSTHIGGISFAKETGAQVVFIPYQGSAPAVRDMLAGLVPVMVDQPSNSLPFVRAGKLNAFAVTSHKRMASAPEIPTVDELGYPGLQVSVWYGLWAPKGTPAPIVQRINSALRATLADPAIQKRLADLGQELPTAEQMTPAGHGAYHRAEIAKWWPIIKAANIKIE